MLNCRILRGNCACGEVLGEECIADVDVAVDERLQGGDDDGALELEVVVETVEYEVHPIGGDAYT